MPATIGPNKPRAAHTRPVGVPMSTPSSTSGLQKSQLQPRARQKKAHGRDSGEDDTDRSLIPPPEGKPCSYLPLITADKFAANQSASTPSTSGPTRFVG